MSANEARKSVALLARAGQARERLHQALEAAGATIVLEDDPAAVDAAKFSAVAPKAVLVALEPAVEDALETLDPLLQAPELLVIFDEADLAARRDGWEAQRWIRHLAAKLHGHADVLPPGCEQDLLIDLQPGHPATPQQLHAEAPFETHLVEAAALAAELPQDRPGEPLPDPAYVEPAYVQPPVVRDWSLTDDAHAFATGRAAAESKPLPDFSRLELVAMVDESADAVVKGAVLVIAGVGGPDAVRKLMGALPPDFARPLLVQLRLDGGRYDNLVKQLARVSPLPVAMAMPGDAIAAATVYVLPERVGIEANEGGMAFIDGSDEPVASLPPAESAVIVLSGAEPSRIDAVLALAARGGHVAGQALEGCYDATAVKLMAAGGAELGTPAQLAEQLGARWP